MALICVRALAGARGDNTHPKALERALAEHFTYDTPAIIERDVWDAVTARFDSNEGFRATQGNATRGPAPKYLLTGLARCGYCGGPIMVGRRKQGRENINVYSCGWRRDRGAAVCSNNAVAPVVEVDAAVIEGVRRFITPAVASEVLRQVRTILNERTAEAPDETARLAGEATKLRQEAARYLRAIGATDDPPDMLVEALADANRRLRLMESLRAAVESISTVLDAELENLEREMHQRLANLHAEFAISPKAAKDVLKTLTGQERLKFAPDNGKLRVVGPIAVPELLISGTGDFKLDGVPREV